MNYDKWKTLYKPVKNPATTENESFEGTLFETFGEDAAFVMEQPQDKIWTLIEGDGFHGIQAGLHIANRMGYFITELPWEVHDIEIDLEIPDDHEEQHYENFMSPWLYGYEKVMDGEPYTLPCHCAYCEREFIKGRDEALAELQRMQHRIVGFQIPIYSMKSIAHLDALDNFVVIEKPPLRYEGKTVLHIYPTKDTITKEDNIEGMQDCLFFDVHIINFDSNTKYISRNKDHFKCNVPIRVMAVYKDGSYCIEPEGPFLMVEGQGITLHPVRTIGSKI